MVSRLKASLEAPRMGPDPRALPPLASVTRRGATWCPTPSAPPGTIVDTAIRRRIGFPERSPPMRVPPEAVAGIAHGYRPQPWHVHGGHHDQSRGRSQRTSGMGLARIG